MLFKEFWELVDELAPGEEVPIKTSVEGNVLTVAIVGINTSTLELGYYSPDGDYVAEGDVSRSDSGKTTICPRFVETNSSWYYTIEQNQYDSLEDMPNVSCRQQLLDLAKVLEDKYGIIKENKEEDNEMENREEQEIELDNGAEMLEEELKEDIRDNFSDEGKSDEAEDPRIVGFQTTLETLCNYIESVNARLTKIEEMLEKDLKKKKKAAKKKAEKAEKKESKKKEAKKEKEKKESKKGSKKKGNKKK